MKLHISGLARIAEANLEFNGITVLVGDNNTGKTTIGKILYTFFNSLSGINDRIYGMRSKKCDELLSTFIATHANTFFPEDWSELIDAYLKNGNASEESIALSVKHVLDGACTDEDLNLLLKQLREVRDIGDHAICEQMVTNNFKQVFSDEYMPAKPRDGVPSVLSVAIKGYAFTLKFGRSDIHYTADSAIEHKAYFIDTPDLIEDVSPNRMNRFNFHGCGLGRRLVRDIAKRMMPREDPGESAIDDIIGNQEFGRILDRIESVIHGKMSKPPRGRVGYYDAEMGSSFKLENISRGIRAFALLQSAVRYRVLGDRDVLILDEPEIHLHPEWIMDYAEILVILQQELNLTVLVTTHSAYFLQALQLYARKHGRSEVLNAYKTAKAADGNIEISKELMSDDWDEAYYSFLRAANRLRKLRDELMEENTEVSRAAD